MKISRPLRAMVERLNEIPDNELHVHHRHLAAHATRLTAAVESLEKLIATPDPTETSAKHTQRVAEASRKLEARVAEIRDKIHDDARAGAETLTRRAEERAGLTESPYAAEVRAAVRSMTPKARDKALVQAMEDGDGATIATLTNAPAIASGLDAKHLTEVRERFVEKHAPQESEALADLMQTFGTVTGIASQVASAARAATDPAAIREIERAQEDAQKAREAFDSA